MTVANLLKIAGIIIGIWDINMFIMTYILTFNLTKIYMPLGSCAEQKLLLYGEVELLLWWLKLGHLLSVLHISQVCVCVCVCTCVHAISEG